LIGAFAMLAERETLALRASEERFRLLVEGVTDYAIFMLIQKVGSQTGMRGAHSDDGDHLFRRMATTCSD
jgi:hypothetical protein